MHYVRDEIQMALCTEERAGSAMPAAAKTSGNYFISFDVYRSVFFSARKRVDVYWVLRTKMFARHPAYSNACPSIDRPPGLGNVDFPGDT